jgi:hypothetical protein
MSWKWYELAALGALTALGGVAGLLMTELPALKITCTLMIGLGAGIAVRAVMR